MSKAPTRPGTAPPVSGEAEGATEEEIRAPRTGG